jgi:cyclophilin family peptidyl-prolyl cis-trans isomerase
LHSYLLLCTFTAHGFQLRQQKPPKQQRAWRGLLHAHHNHCHHHLDNNERRTAVTSSFEAGAEEQKVSCEKVENKEAVVSMPLQRRRSMLHSLALSSLALCSTTTMLPIRSSLAAAPSTTSTTPTPTPTITFISPDQATVTDKVYMNVRISRQDGTFYVRDDLPDTPENKVFYARLVFGLFGKEAPRHVEKFKSYIVPPKSSTSLNENNDDDDPLPLYDRSTFTSFDQATGILMGGKITSLELTEMAGSTALRYGGRLLPASLWLEQRNNNNSNTNRIIISHSARGLLTHRQLEALPDFGITTRSDTTMLDRTHVVFGKLILDDDAQAFLNIVSNLPTYGLERPNPINNESELMTAASSSRSSNPALVDDAAAAVFNAQRQFFRKTAKAFGDSRLDKLYEGKLLRRVEVTSTGIL